MIAVHDWSIRRFLCVSRVTPHPLDFLFTGKTVHDSWCVPGVYIESTSCRVRAWVRGHKCTLTFVCTGGRKGAIGSLSHAFDPPVCVFRSHGQSGLYCRCGCVRYGSVFTVGPEWPLPERLCVCLHVVPFSRASVGLHVLCTRGVFEYVSCPAGRPSVRHLAHPNLLSTIIAGVTGAFNTPIVARQRIIAQKQMMLFFLCVPALS